MNAPADPADHLSTWNCHAGDVAFAITAPSRWLRAQRDYLSQFVTAAPGELDLGAFSIRVHTGDAAFRRIVSTVASSPATRQVEPVPGLVIRESTRQGGRTCYSITTDGVERQAGAYAAASQGRRIDLFVHSGTERPHRYPIRFIREAMLRTYEDAGGVIFHAAGVETGSAGVMICGPRGAGKTTTTAALMRSADAALLSNDRLIAHHGDRLVAVPLPVPTARGTIEAFPELKRPVRGAIDETAELDKMPADFGSTVKHSFSPLRFARAFGAGLIPASVLRLVVVPHLTDTSEPAHLRHLPEAQAVRIIAENCFTPRDEFWIRTWIVPRHRGDDLLQRQADAAVRHIAATVPCVEVSFGVRNPAGELVRELERMIRGIR